MILYILPFFKFEFFCSQNLIYHPSLLLRCFPRCDPQKSNVCKQSPTERAPVLRHGGSSEFVNAKYIPYLLTHAEYLDTVIEKVEQYIATHTTETPTATQSGGSK